MMNTVAWTLSEASAIVDQLNWKVAPDISATHNVEQILFNVLNIELSDLTHSCDNSCDSAASLVASLSLEAKFKVLRHPYVAGHLRKDIKLDRNQFLYYLASGVLATSSIGEPCNNTFDANTNEVEKRLLLTIESPIKKGFSFCLFDYDSNLQIPEIDEQRSWTNGLDYNSAKAVVSKIEAALSNLYRVSESALSFVESYLWYLAVRANTKQPNNYASFTFQDLPGLILLCNPHMKSVEVYSIEESLLHESIHCFLCWVEYLSTGILRHSDMQNIRCISPWTGNSIYPRTAIHAVLVWHGLGQYFKACFEAKIEPLHTAYFRDRYRFIEQGFRSSQFVDFYKKLIALCSEESALILRMVCEDYLL